MKMAAAEALYDTEQPAAVLAPHHRQPGRVAGEVRDQGARGCCRSWPPAHFDGPGRGHQRAARAVPADLRPGPGRALLLPRRLHAEHPGHLLDLPADDRPRAWPRRCSRRWSCGRPGGDGRRAAKWLAGWPWPLPLLPLLGQLVRLDLHRDGPPAVGRLRPDDHRARRLPGGQHGRGPHLADRLHPPVRRARRRRGPAAPDLHPPRRRPSCPSRPTDGRTPATPTSRWPSPTDRGAETHGTHHRLVRPDRRPLDRATSASRASTSASACCCRCWPRRTTPSAGS